MSVEARLRERLLEVLQALDLARADAKQLAYAFSNRMRPPAAVLMRAHSYGALVPVDTDDEPTAVTQRAFPAPAAGSNKAPSREHSV